MDENKQHTAEMSWHARSAEETLRAWAVDEQGLSKEEVLVRRARYGPNAFDAAKRIPWYILLLRQFRSLLILILLIAAAIAWSAGKMVDVYVILAVVLINALIGFFQELKAENAVEALKRMIVQKARVRRGGETLSLPAIELVPGDILLIEEGDSIPADARVIGSRNLRMVEASLTGESVPVSKENVPLGEDLPLADRRNMLWKGTYAVAGIATAVVCATGQQTALGQIAETLAGISGEKTNFQKKTDTLARQMAIIAILSALALFVTGYFLRNMEINEIMLVSIAALVSSIPEGLPAVLSIVLAIGSHRMAGRNAIIREITSVETLGAVTTIITDKTGTLTQNMLTVKKIGLGDGDELDVSGDGWFPAGNFYRDKQPLEPEEDPRLSKLLLIAGASNNAAIKHDQEKDSYELVGDPTEGALLVLAKKGGISMDRVASGQKLDDLPFNSKTKFRATLYTENDRPPEVLVVGAPEKVLALSNRILTNRGEEPLTESQRQELEARINQWSSKAMRVIGLAYRQAADDRRSIEDADVCDLVFAGFTGMIDPPRPDVREAVEKCRSAGIRVIMATGDHIHTALAIARATGIVDQDADGQVQAMTESQLLQLDEKEFEEAITRIHVFARLTPTMKLRIAETLQARDELVAMTGDGVNDAPALKRADVGVAMGIMGTDVAREAAKVVLADDNFATIVSAVEEGRIVFTNARQTSYFLLTTNFSEITILISLVALGYPIALTATQILWLNLVTDGVGDKALATERGHGDVLQDKPLTKKDQILNKGVFPFLIMQTVIMTTLALLVYFHYLDEGLNKARTAVFTTMAFSQLFNLLNLRSLRKSLFEIGPFSNKWINLALLISFTVQIIIIEIPFFVELFHFKPLSALEFVVMIVMSSTVLWAGEIYKFIRRKTRQPGNERS
jgi:P-type Ca2+ transporter type 2C